MRFVAAALGLAALAAPVAADETTGDILAYDRKAGIVVLSDRTVWELQPGTLIPAYLDAGDRVRIVYQTAGEDGITAIDELERVEN